PQSWNSHSRPAQLCRAASVEGIPAHASPLPGITDPEVLRLQLECRPLNLFHPARLPFHQKVQLWLIASVAGTLCLAAGIFLLDQVRETRQLFATSIAGVTRATAANCRAAAVSGDSGNARESLSALAGSPGIIRARLTRRDRSLIAEYSPGHSAGTGSALGRILVLTEPVKVQDETVGFLTIEADDSALLGGLIRRYVLVELAITLLAVLLALTIARQLQRRVSRPLQMLAAVADRFVEGKNYSLRAPVTESDGEVTSFTRAFNRMLNRVQDQDNALLEAQQQLTAQVEQLTHEVGERRRLERERLELERHILASQKLEGLGLLAGGIAHDFNNLLTPILGHLSMIEQDLPRQSPLAVPVRDSIAAARSAANLCRQMLAYAGKGRFELTPQDLNSVLVECRELLLLSVDKRVRLTLQPGTALPPVVADRTQLQQIMMNLVINASEAIPEKSMGRITVRADVLVVGPDSGFPRCHPAPPAPGRYVVLEVADNGTGISESVCQRIFEPFFTTKFTGRGLGLAAVMGIVRSHSAILSLETAPGAGTTFRVLFPGTPTETPPVRAAVPVPATQAAGTILLIDDEPLVLSVAVAVCQRLGFQTLAAHSGQEGITLFRQHAGRITAVLLDQTMPGLDGGATFRLLYDFNPDIPVVLMSGLSEREAQKNFPALPLAGFLQKPFLYQDLADMLATVTGSPRAPGAHGHGFRDN
ncbi:MAG: ATP-binding protein, partial [Opitutales bacterium]